MLSEPRTLVRRLTSTATTALENAVSRAVSSRHREIDVDHMLIAMLEDDEGDVGALLRRMGRNRARLREEVERAMQARRCDSEGKPVFAETLFHWFEDAWLYSSLEHEATRLRTGALMLQLVRANMRYTAESFPALTGIDVAEIERDFRTIVAGTAETAEAVDARPIAGNPVVDGPAAGRRALDRFTTSLTERARAGKLDRAFGRHHEIRQIIDILGRRRKNNPIIVGEPGVGKTAVVEGLAIAIAEGDVPESLRDVDLRTLDLALLSAGAGVRGEFENRLKSVIGDVKASPKPIILFIDEAHTIIGAGGQAGSGGDAANLLKPELARGELRTIAATTWSEYKKYFERDAALERRFQPIKVDEPSVDNAIGMLRGLRPLYEEAHGVAIPDEAVVAAVKLSQRYVSGRQLPDKAVDVLDTAAARVHLESGAKPAAILDIEAEVAACEREHQAQKRDRAGGEQAIDEELVHRLEEKRAAVAKLTTQWQSELAAVTKVQAARKACENAPEANLAELRATLRAANAELASTRHGDPLVHGEVDADVVARIVADWTGVPVGRLQAETVATVLNLEEKLRERVRGQDMARRTIAETLRMSFAGVRDPNTPIGALLFVGPSGVGKTEAALSLAEALYGGERFMTTINMSEFQEKHTVSRLIGSPPGYVGYGEGGVLTEAVRQRPYSVVLLEECEKADLEVMNLFYQVFDKGSLSDGEGRNIDFRNTVIVMTSNLGAERIAQLCADAEKAPSADELAEAIRPQLSRHFKPALLARMTVVPFGPLSAELLGEIADLKLRALANRVQATHGLATIFAPAVKEAIVQRCTDTDSGARNIEHILRASLMPAVARELLLSVAQGGSPRRLDIGLDSAGAWQVALVS